MHDIHCQETHVIKQGVSSRKSQKINMYCLGQILSNDTKYVCYKITPSHVASSEQLNNSSRETNNSAQVTSSTPCIWWQHGICLLTYLPAGRQSIKATVLFHKALHKGLIRLFRMNTAYKSHQHFSSSLKYNPLSNKFLVLKISPSLKTELTGSFTSSIWIQANYFIFKAFHITYATFNYVAMCKTMLRKCMSPVYDPVQLPFVRSCLEFHLPGYLGTASKVYKS